MTLISALGCPGLTDNPFHGKIGIYLRCLRLTDNSLSGSCRLLGALSGSDGRTAVLRFAREFVGQLNKLLCLHNGRYQP